MMSILDFYYPQNPQNPHNANQRRLPPQDNALAYNLAQAQKQKELATAQNAQNARTPQTQAQTQTPQSAEPLADGVFVADSAKAAETINAAQNTDPLLALNNKHYPQAINTPPETNETYKTIYTLGQRNTGVAYFDNKKDLTLLDAYIAKQLGLKVARLEHKIDLKSDNKHRIERTHAYKQNYNRNRAVLTNSLIAALHMAHKTGLTATASRLLREYTGGIIGDPSGVVRQALQTLSVGEAYANQPGSNQKPSNAEIERYGKIYMQNDSFPSIRATASIQIDKLLAGMQAQYKTLSHLDPQAREMMGKDLRELSELNKVMKHGSDEEFLQAMVRASNSGLLERVADETQDELEPQSIWRDPMVEN